MLNIGGGELLVIFLVALIVLGPTKLPEVARQLGGAMRELRKISSGFQAEMRSAMEDPVEAMSRERGQRVVSSEQRATPAASRSLAPNGDSASIEADTPVEPDAPAATTADVPARSTAEAAGMYDVHQAADVSPADIDDTGDSGDTGDTGDTHP